MTDDEIEKIGKLFDVLGAHGLQLAPEAGRYVAALAQIEAIASGSTTANSLPHIAQIAREALRGPPGIEQEEK